MPEIITSHLTHIYWALFCLLVAVLVHFWPTIKTWWAARKAAAEAEAKRVKAAAEAEAKRVKAALELAAGDVESVYTRIKGDLQAYVAGTEAKIKALEAKIDAQVKADEAKVQAAASNGQAPPVEPPPAQAPVAELETPNLVHGWVPPVAQA
jgi:hypothetical protein